MPKACELKKGSIVAINGAPHVLEELKVSTPSARGAASIYRFRFRNLITKNKLDAAVKGDEMYSDIDLDRRPVQYLYREGDLFTFMELDSFEQFGLSEDMIADQLPYLVEDMEGISALVSDGKVLAIELPQKVVMTIERCDPVMKGATVTSRSKPATCQTGLVVMVPEYMEQGEEIIVDTATGTFQGRATVSKF
ncbi:MAG: elongation factor P [Kiritimatiellae bacterium]|nr:elongation factor P [Kiritimatiellia bacterium]